MYCSWFGASACMHIAYAFIHTQMQVRARPCNKISRIIIINNIFWLSRNSSKLLLLYFMHKQNRHVYGMSVAVPATAATMMLVATTDDHCIHQLCALHFIFHNFHSQWHFRFEWRQRWRWRRWRQNKYKYINYDGRILWYYYIKHSHFHQFPYLNC